MSFRARSIHARLPQAQASLPQLQKSHVVVGVALLAAAIIGVAGASSSDQAAASTTSKAHLVADVNASLLAQSPTVTPKPTAKPKPKDPSLTPSGLITPVRHYHFTAVFGQPGPWSSGYHTGLDFAAPEGTPIRAVADGVVKAAGPGGAYGNLLQIQIKKNVEAWTAHMESISVSVGDHVKRGQIVGYVGMTGHTTGPHCHFEIRIKGQYINPATYMWPNGGQRRSL